jgi:predicted ArsR family transcriptional regulator
MSLDEKARILETVSSSSCGVRDVIKKLACRASRVISLLKEMEQEQLIEFQNATQSKRGRPRKNVVCTDLGFEFLEAHRRLRMKTVRVRKEDLDRAVKDALYVQRLVANGHSPFKLFMELNDIACNIKISSETSGIVRK